LENVKTDSTQLLQLEKNIKGHVESPNGSMIFLMLAAIFVKSEDQQIKQFAAIVLRNSIQTYFSDIENKFESELVMVEKVLFVVLETEGISKKVYQELSLIVSKICQKRSNSEKGNNDLFLSIIASYQNHFNMQTLDCLIQIFETIDDDRMWKYVPMLLSHSINYLQHDSANKVLYFI
jgi:hypothetical protein